jgi:hypothetical protein
MATFVDIHRRREPIMFTVWRSNGFDEDLVGSACCLDEVIEHVEMSGTGRYQVYETQIRCRHWGSVTRNPDGTFTLRPNKSVTLRSWPTNAIARATLGSLA